MGMFGDLKSSSLSLTAGVHRGSKVIMADKTSRIQMLFALAFFGLSMMSFAISVYSNSLVVSLNGFVLLYRVMLHVGEAATKAMTSTVVTAGAEKGYSYGLMRFDVLAQFASLAMLCFACLTAVIEGLQHMLQEHDVNPVSVELLCLLHIGTIVASSIKTNREGYLRAKRRGQKDLAIYFVLECLGPLTCFVTVNLISMTGMSRLDILAAMCLTVGTVMTAWEQIGKVSGILLLQAPIHLKPLLDRALREVAVITGVLEVREAKFWTLVDGHLVATLRLRLSEQASQGSVLQDVRNVMSALVGTLTVEFEDSNSVGGINSSFNTTPTAMVAGNGFGDHNHSHSHGQCHHHHHHHHELPPAPLATSHSTVGGDSVAAGATSFPAAPETSGSTVTIAPTSTDFNTALPPPPGMPSSSSGGSGQAANTEVLGLGGMPPPPLPPPPQGGM